MVVAIQNFKGLACQNLFFNKKTEGGLKSVWQLAIVFFDQVESQMLPSLAWCFDLRIYPISIKVN